MKIEPAPSPTGKGWGNGNAVEAFNRRRTVNISNTYTGFRPRVENEASYYTIRNWCHDKRIRRSFSSIFNSIMDGICVACLHTTEIDEDGNVSIEINLGRVIID